MDDLTEKVLNNLYEVDKFLTVHRMTLQCRLSAREVSDKDKQALNDKLVRMIEVIKER